MENKQYLESLYNVNYDSAMNYAKQGNLSATEISLKRALDAVIKLMKMTFGKEQEAYKAKADRIVELLKSIKQKIEEANKQKPATPGPAGTKKAEPKEIAPKEKIPVEQALAKLNELTGLSGVKKEVSDLVAELQAQLMREECGIKNADPPPRHLVFKGNPGTGKTTVARIMADIYYSLGVLKGGQLVEVQRTDLVAGYVGQTAPKTQEKIDEAMGGVLFIDEAYTLAKGGNDFGQEAIDTLLKAMEDHRDEIIVIVAGYDKPIEAFIESNAGLKSRFPTYIHFSDYTGDEMFMIFENMCKKNSYMFGDEARNLLKNYFNNLYANRDENFGNARDVRNFFDKVKRNQSVRLYNMKKQGQTLSREDLMTILPQDLPIK